ncbi:MAG: outer membrane beta-barrel protein [Nitrospira sp.]|nr:outer membrane beta-barrel protein [Nitrospira sp.]
MNLFFCRSYVERNWLFRFTVIAMLVVGTFQVNTGHAQTTVIPSAHVSGYYDTNIWSRPKDFLPVGTRLDDYVTSVGGAVELLHETRDIDAKLKLGGDFNAYMENSGLNFFNAKVNGTIGLDRWVDQYIRGAKLRVTENFRFTPQSPGFLTGVRQTISQDNTFFTGLQAFRANTFINTTAVTGSYPISRDLALEGGYTFGLRKFGSILGGDAGGVRFFNTTSNTWFGGPRYQLSKNDSVAALYRQSFILQSRADGGRSFATNLVTLAGNYEKKLQEWEFKVEAGVTFVEPAGGAFPTGNLTVSTVVERDTVLKASLFREARPSVFLVGGAVLSNVAQAGISHRIYERLTLEGDAAFGYNQFFPDTRNTTFQNFTGSTRLAYKLTRDITAEISYTFNSVKSDTTAVQYQFSRHVMGFFLSAEWK